MKISSITISVAKKSNLEEVNMLIRNCAKSLLDNGLKQWNENYPSKKILLGDIESKTLFVYKEESKILGAVVANQKQDKEYELVNWNDKSTRYLVIHRLAVMPNNQRKGIGKKLMNFVEEYAREKNFNSIRLDTFSLNQTSIKFYRNLGYTELDQIHLPYQPELFICFEKLIK